MQTQLKEKPKPLTPSVRVSSGFFFLFYSTRGILLEQFDPVWWVVPILMGEVSLRMAVLPYPEVMRDYSVVWQAWKLCESHIVAYTDFTTSTIVTINGGIAAFRGGLTLSWDALCWFFLQFVTRLRLFFFVPINSTCQPVSFEKALVVYLF